MTTQHYTPKHKNAGEFVERTTLEMFYEKYIKGQEPVGIRAFMFWGEDSEIVDIRPSPEPYTFFVNSLEGSNQMTGEHSDSTVVTVYKSEPAQPAPDKYFGLIFMLNTLTGQVESCDPLRWDSYPLHWRQIDRADFDKIQADPNAALAISLQVKARDKDKLNAMKPARPVAVGRSELVEAVRNLYRQTNGQVDEFGLWRFIQDVLRDQKPAPSPDPAPLIEALTCIETGATGDYPAGNVARNGLDAYKAGVSLETAFNAQKAAMTIEFYLTAQRRSMGVK